MSFTEIEVDWKKACVEGDKDHQIANYSQAKMIWTRSDPYQILLFIVIREGLKNIRNSKMKTYHLETILPHFL